MNNTTSYDHIYLLEICSNATHRYMNQEQCGKITVWNLLSLKDFKHSYENPFFMTYTFWPNYNTTEENISSIHTYSMIFFAVCYAYSLCRLVINFAIISYAVRKIRLLLAGKEIKERIRDHPHLAYEINVYKWIIYLGIFFEFVMALHNFVLWRGLQYYTTYQDHNFPPNVKPPRVCNCIYNSLLYNFNSLEVLNIEGLQLSKSGWLIIMYSLWIFLKILNTVIIYFSVISLSRINRKGKVGKDLVKGAIKKSIILGLFYGIILFYVIFMIDIPIFYRFYNIQVLGFWFFWKTLGFLLLLDRLHSKYWLFQIIKIQSLYTHKNQWKKKLDEIKENILYEDSENLISNMEETLKNKSDLNKVDTIAISNMININQVKIREVFKGSINKFHDTVKRHIIESNEKDKKSKLKTNWADYLNYFLGLNLLGLIGYFFLILDALDLFYLDSPYDPKMGPSFCYYVGILFCYLEIGIYDLTHGIFLLHCFFIELFKFLKKYPNLNESDLNLSEQLSDYHE